MLTVGSLDVSSSKYCLLRLIVFALIGGQVEVDIPEYQTRRLWWICGLLPYCCPSSSIIMH